MSSSSSASVSYTAGVPGSQVTLNITKDGNRSLTLSRGSNSKTSSSVPVPVGQRKFPDGYVGPANIPFCKVCYDAGLPVADYTDHFVKNQPGPGGKVVCPTLLAQKCLVCGVAGHTTSYCPLKHLLESQDVEKAQQEREKAKKENGGWETVGAKGQVVSPSSVKPKPHIEDMSAKKPAPTVAVVAPVVKYGGSFGVLAVDDSSDSEEEYKDVPKPVRKEAVPPPSTAEASKPLTWAQRAAAAAQKPVPVSSSSSSSSAASVIDTRFQFHTLCDNIQESKRASKKATHIPPPPPPQTEATQQPVNARAAAAAVASESSKKRKQNAALVPA